MILQTLSCEKERVSGQQDILHIPKTDHSVTLLFYGDIIQHLPQVYGAYNSEENDYKYLQCFKHIAPYWVDANFVIANLETTLSDTSFSGYPKFRSPWQITRDLHQMGVTTFVMANNHCCDQSAQGLRSTMYYLDSLGISYTGIFKDSLHYQKRHPLYLRKNSFKIALLNYTYGTNDLPVPKGFIVSLTDTILIKQDIQKTKRDSATHVIAFMHWGDEYVTRPNAQQKRLATWLHTQGVDIVIGSHPHVVQPTEYTIINQDTVGITAYSLGNFISNQTFLGTDGGMGLRLTLTRDTSRITHYHMEHLKFYIYRPFEEGQRRYYVIPEHLANCIVNNRDSICCKRFFQITDSILKGEPAKP